MDDQFSEELEKVILDDGFGGDGSLAGVMAMETFLKEFNNEVPHEGQEQLQIEVEDPERPEVGAQDRDEGNRKRRRSMSEEDSDLEIEDRDVGSKKKARENEDMIEPMETTVQQPEDMAARADPVIPGAPIRPRVPSQPDLETPVVEPTRRRTPRSFDLEEDEEQPALNPQVDKPEIRVQGPSDDPLDQAQSLLEDRVEDLPLQPEQENETEQPGVQLNNKVVKKKKKGGARRIRRLKVDTAVQIPSDEIRRNIESSEDTMRVTEVSEAPRSWSFTKPGRKLGSALRNLYDMEMRFVSTKEQVEEEEFEIVRNVTLLQANQSHAQLSMLENQSRLSVNNTNLSLPDLRSKDKDTVPTLDVLVERTNEGSQPSAEPQREPAPVENVEAEQQVDELPAQEAMEQPEVDGLVLPDPPLLDTTPQEHPDEQLPPMMQDQEVEDIEMMEQQQQEAFPAAAQYVNMISAKEFMRSIEDVCDDGGRDGETSFQEVCPLSEKRSVAARNFFSLLVLEKKCCIKTEQEQFFGQISIRLQDQDYVSTESSVSSSE